MSFTMLRFQYPVLYGSSCLSESYSMSVRFSLGHLRHSQPYVARRRFSTSWMWDVVISRGYHP